MYFKYWQVDFSKPVFMDWISFWCVKYKCIVYDNPPPPPPPPFILYWVKFVTIINKNIELSLFCYRFFTEADPKYKVRPVSPASSVRSYTPLGNVYIHYIYVIKFVSDLCQVGGFLWVLQFPPPIKLTAMI